MNDAEKDKKDMENRSHETDIYADQRANVELEMKRPLDKENA